MLTGVETREVNNASAKYSRMYRVSPNKEQTNDSLCVTRKERMPKKRVRKFREFRCFMGVGLHFFLAIFSVSLLRLETGHTLIQHSYTYSVREVYFHRSALNKQACSAIAYVLLLVRRVLFRPTINFTRPS